MCVFIIVVIVCLVETPNGKSEDEEGFREITVVTITPKEPEAKEYIDFDLRNLSIVRTEGEEDVINNRGSREPASVTEVAQGNEPDTYDNTADDSADKRDTGETDSGQEQWSEPEDIVSEDGDGEPMPELVESEPELSAEESYDDEYEDRDNGQYESEVDSGLTYLGTWTATAYCPGPCCCGEYASGYTASGTLATEGRTVACNSLPFGTQIYIEGYGYYIVEDTGWSPYDPWLDIFFESHDAALAFGLRDVEVYMVN